MTQKLKASITAAEKALEAANKELEAAGDDQAKKEAAEDKVAAATNALEVAKDMLAEADAKAKQAPKTKPASKANTKATKDDEPKDVIRVTSKVEGFRRAGVSHSKTPTSWPEGAFTDTEIEQLKAEPNLVVEDL